MDARALSILGCVTSSQKKHENDDGYKKTNEKVNKIKIIPTLKLSKEYDKKNLINKNEDSEESDGKSDAIIKNTVESLKCNVSEESPQKVVSTQTSEANKDGGVDNSKNSDITQVGKTPAEIALAKLLSMESTVEVVTANVKKKYVFKNAVKVVNGQKYMCKMGYNEQNLLVYNKCVWIGQGSSAMLPSSNSDDVTQYFELS